MKRVFSLILILILMLGLAAPASAAKAKAAVMRLQLAEGSVTVMDAGGKVLTYQKDMRLYSGYTVSTDSAGSAYILLDDTKAVKLDRNTTVTIKKSGRKLQVKVKAGQLFFNVTAPLASNEALEVRTSSMIVGIRGSSGIVSTKQVIFLTGHGVVYCGGSSYALSGGKGFQPQRGVFTAGIHDYPSFALREVRDDSRLQSQIRGEGIYVVDQLIDEIPAAAERDEKERRDASRGAAEPPQSAAPVPAFGSGGSGSESETFTITWMNGKTVLGIDQVAKGKFPFWSGDTPWKEADAGYTYEFNGWEPVIVAAESDATYSASFIATPKTYTITWQDYDGTVIDKTTVPYGEMPSHNPAVREGDGTHTYTFSGWTPALSPVSGDAVYTASYTADAVVHTITWRDYDGTLIDTTTVPYGEIPSHAAPTRAADKENTYSFSGWTPSLAAVTKDTTYTAAYTASAREYTITWKRDDGSVIDTTSVAYGDTPSHAAVSKAGSDTYSYEFIGWDKPLTAVTGDTTYTAEFEKVYDFKAIIPTGSEHVVSFRSEGGRQITTAKAGEEFTFYLSGDIAYVKLNGHTLEKTVHEAKVVDADLKEYTFIVPEDPVIEITVNK